MEDHLSSSQNSDLNSKQLDEIEQKAQAKNTKRATKRGAKKFEKWCKKRKISVDLKTVSLTDLSEILRRLRRSEDRGRPSINSKCIDWN